MSKLSDYLLATRPKNDKSGFLAQAGFIRTNAAELELALRRILEENEAHVERVDDYGTFYSVEGALAGPDAILNVATIWLLSASDGSFRFVTLKPARKLHGY